MLTQLTTAEQKEVSCYGCTVAQMREAVEQSFNFRFRDPVTCAMAILCSAQESIQGDNVEWMAREDARQAINRAKWVLATYVRDVKVAA